MVQEVGIPMTTEASDPQTDGTEAPKVSPIDEVNRIIDEEFSKVPKEERERARPALVRWLNEKAGIGPDGADA